MLIVVSYVHDIDSLILLARISNDPFGHMLSEQIYDPTRYYALHIANMWLCNILIYRNKLIYFFLKNF
jgi:hypothetical protein